MIRPRIVLAALLAALAVAGCGGDDSETAASPSPPPAATPTAAGPATISKDLKSEPQIPQPTGRPAVKLVRRDIVKGKGAAAKKGDKIAVQYTGVSFSTGDKFDASWDRGAEPFRFALGTGHVIPGWDKGIPGMRVGGRRELIIPSDLAYGAQGRPPAIAPNEALVFVVDLVKIG